MMVGRFVVVWAGIMAAAGVPAGAGFGDQGCVRFDAPVSVAACDTGPAEAGSTDPAFRLVRLDIPVSTRVTSDARRDLLQMQIELRTAGSGVQVIDYAPRTTLYSDIDGPVSVQQGEESSRNLGLDIGGSLVETVKLGATVGGGTSRNQTESFQRIPEQKLLLASGSSHRGSGVYFKFRASPQTTLEGGHELSITLRVPRSWRGGIVRVDCTASGTAAGMLGRVEPFLAGTESFLVATWLEGDDRARAIVSRYCEVEARLRHVAASEERQRAADGPGLIPWPGTSSRNLPAGWSGQLPLVDSRSIQSRIRPHLSPQMQEVTDQFLASRSRVLQLAR